MITMKTIRSLALRCPEAAYVGVGAPSVFGSGADLRWFEQRGHQSAVSRIVELIPTNVAVNGTGLSAPPERSP